MKSEDLYPGNRIQDSAPSVGISTTWPRTTVLSLKTVAVAYWLLIGQLPQNPEFDSRYEISRFHQNLDLNRPQLRVSWSAIHVAFYSPHHRRLKAVRHCCPG